MSQLKSAIKIEIHERIRGSNETSIIKATKKTTMRKVWNEKMNLTNTTNYYNIKLLTTHSNIEEASKI